MKKYVILVLMSILILHCKTAIASQIRAAVEGPDISGLRVITKYHSNTDFRDYALVYTDKVEGCARGVYFNVESHSAVYSTMLAAKMSNHKKFIFVADSAQRAPWGDDDFCSLNSLELQY